MKIAPSDWQVYPAAERLFAVLAQMGGEARFVGGCVRDAVVGRPIGDIDVACTHQPEITLTLLEQASIRVIPTGLAHGTVTAVLDGFHFEITALREDIETDGRRAVVRYTHSWQADASRRDFTMNALSAGLDGEVHDYFNGIEDALAGKLRFIGDPIARIEEDALRILRFFRFFAHYGTPPFDSAGLASCAAKAALIDTLSGERIQSEMFKLLRSDKAAFVLTVMEEQDVLSHVGLKAVNTEAVVRLGNPVLKLAALLHGQDISPLAARWRLSNKDRDWLSHLTALDVAAILAWNEAAAKKSLRKLGKALFIAQAELTEALTGTDLSHWLELAKTWEIPAFPVNGAMLKAKGIPEGKILGEALKRLETKWETEDYRPTAEELLTKL